MLYCGSTALPSVPTPSPHPPRSFPLSLKLATTVLLLVVIPLLLVAYLNAREVESQSVHRETQSLQRRSAAAAHRLEERVGRLRAYVELVANNPTILAAVEDLAVTAPPSPTDPTPPPPVDKESFARAFDSAHPEIYDLLISLRRANPWFENVYLLDPDGVCIATSERTTKPEMVGRPYDYRPYFQAALEERAPFVSDVLKNATSPGTGIFVSSPVLLDDAVAAVVVLKVESAALHEVVADLARTGGGALLVDRFGVVVSDAWTGALRDTSDPQSLQFHPLASVDRFMTLFEQTRRYGTPDGEHYLDRVQEPLPLDQLWNALHQGHSGAAEHAFPSAWGHSAVPTMVGYAPVMAGHHETPYGYVVLGEPAADFRGPLREIAESSLLRSTLVAVGVALVIALLIRRFSRQVVDLAERARRLADGERTVSPLPWSRGDELGELARNIQRLADHVHEAVEAERTARVASEHARDAAEAIAQARTEAVARAHSALDSARRALEAASDPSARANLRKAAATLEGVTLDLAALAEDGSLRPEPRRLSVPALVQEVLDARSDDTPERPVTLVVEGTVPELPVDRAMLRRIVEHLLDNACKFTRRGHVELRVQPHGEGLALAIVDTGIGLTARQAARIGSEDAGPVGTSGIGLWVTRRLAKALGATLHAEGEVGKGSTVTVELPGPTA